jgi:hypothetical protein
MFFVMVEIANYRQLTRLRSTEAAEIRTLLEHFCQNRGGRLVKEQNGYFLFAFHPLREKVLDQVSDFLFLTADSLQRKKDDLFGFSLLLDHDEQGDETATFNRLKALLFTAPRENRIWAGPAVLGLLPVLLPVSEDRPLAEILGPPPRLELSPLPVELLLEMTGWIEALKAPLSRQLAETGDRRQGKILRLKGTHLAEKYFVLRTVLHQIYGPHEDFPVLFPLEDSHDFVSQLLARVDSRMLAGAPPPEDASWTALLACRGGGDYPGDSSRDDVVGALTHYFRSVSRHLVGLGLPPVFVFLFPHGYEPEAQKVLETILSDLVSREGLRLLLLEHQDTSVDFLARQPSLSWTFPALSLDRILHERDTRGWQERFPDLTRKALEACAGRGMGWVHHLWSLQNHESSEPAEDGADPSWTLFASLDSSHHKVYYVLWASRGLLEESSLVAFFHQWGEDAAVIEDKVKSLKALGYLLPGLSRPLRPDFGPRLAQRLGGEGRELLAGLGQYLHRQWTVDHRLSEVLFLFLRDTGLQLPSVEVLSYYLTNKINQGQGDFLLLLRKDLWESAPTDELKEHLRLVAAAAKLRFALNLPVKSGSRPSLERFRRYFTKTTETQAHGEWQLQQGRFYLRSGDLAPGFSLLKRALLEAQERQDKSLEVRAETEIGLALLRKNRLEEGREYFDIASRLAEKAGSGYLTALTSGLNAVALFLLGHLTAADAALAKGLAASDRGGLQHSKVFLEFLRARSEFDRGDYASVRASLDRASAVSARYRLAEAEPVLEAWKGRAEAYAGNTGTARAILEALAPSAERDYFLSESYYLDRNFPLAWDKIREARSHVLATQPFGSGERVSWATGFAAVEDRALASPGDVGVLQNQIEGFLLLIEGLVGDPAGAAPRFNELLARKALLDLDPASAQFYFWYYFTVPKNDSRQEAHRLTLLGRSLKDVQVRSSRIEDPVKRQDYLSKPHWNAQFALEARRLKLL